MKITTTNKNGIIEYDFHMNIGKARDLLSKNKTFRSTCTQILQSVPYPDYVWYLCKIGKGCEVNPFKFTVKQTVFDCKEDPKTFDAVNFDKSMNIIPNLSKNALLLVPKYLKTEKRCYSSISKFMRYGPPNQVDDFWKALADILTYPVNAWISTHGHGVCYLHLRIDSQPKYLNWVPIL